MTSQQVERLLHTNMSLINKLTDFTIAEEKKWERMETIKIKAEEKKWESMPTTHDYDLQKKIVNYLVTALTFLEKAQSELDQLDDELREKEEV